MGELLPLFPLSAPLLPGTLLPLHIFEDRYRQLVEELLARPPGARREFGVVAIRRGFEVGAGSVPALHGVGCTAQLSHVERLADGTFDIVVLGADRFRLERIEGSSAPYLVAELSRLPDAPAAPSELAAAARHALAEYLQALAEAGVEDAALRGDLDGDVALSYALAAAMVLDPHDMQQLLEAPDDESRLRAELRLLRREVALLGASGSVPAGRFSGGLASAN